MPGCVLLLPIVYTWRNVVARGFTTGVTLIGVAVSVMVYVVMAATADGIERVSVSSGDPRNLIVLSDGANSAESSRLSRATMDVVRFLPGVARSPGGEPLVSVELLSSYSVPRRGARPRDFANSRYTTVRGVTPLAFEVHSGTRLVTGRLPRAPGEIMVGRLVSAKLGEIALGDELRFGIGPHRVVGIFAAEGQVFESEIWADFADLQSEMDVREASLMVLRVQHPHAAPVLLEELRASRRVNVDVRPEVDYYADIQRGSTAFAYLGNLIGLLMGLGAVVAGTNTMYAAMSRRVREMGTLRALGFGRRNVGGALVVESSIVGALGGILGVGLALAFDGIPLSLVGLAFEIDVRASSVLQGLCLAVAIGFLGGLLPARAATRLEIVDALRHT
jgi:ABC-type antimicrobial peptide transport system permease subunit